MISIICPVYNEEKVVVTTIRKIKDAVTLMQRDHEILVIDDGSTDRTYDILQNLGVCVIRHPYNKGNGAAVKTGIRYAKGDVIVLIDGDGQHNPEDIPRLVSYIGEYDLVVGARLLNSKGSLHRNLANIAYNLIASYLTDMRIQDLTSGFRAFKADLIKQFVHTLPNKFSYPATSTILFAKEGYSIKYIPIEVERRIGRSKINIFHDGVRFLIIIFRITLLYHPLKLFSPISIFMFSLGGILTMQACILKQRLFMPNAAVLFITTAVLVFLMGMVSEQISMLHSDYREAHSNNEKRWL